MNMISNILSFPLQPVMPRLRRPSTLVRAAVAGQGHWRRDRDLRRVLQSENLPAPGSALPWLRAEEDRMNVARQEGAAHYDLHQHVLLMIAILAESRVATLPPAHADGRARAPAWAGSPPGANPHRCGGGRAPLWPRDHLPRNNEPSTPLTIT